MVVTEKLSNNCDKQFLVSEIIIFGMNLKNIKLPEIIIQLTWHLNTIDVRL